MSRSTDEPILMERKGHVALLTLNRPKTRNALSGEDMFAAFESLFAQLDADGHVRVAVLTGSGTAFCSGGNILEMKERSGMFTGSAEQITAGYRQGIQRIPRAFQKLRMPIIAAVNGPAIGAGNDLACMCDLRVASNDATFAESFVKLGIVPGDGGCWFLPRIVGMSMASQLALTGETITAAEALRIGLVSQVVPSATLIETALSLADRIAANPPLAVRWTKQLLHASLLQSLDQALDQAGKVQGMAHQTEEHRMALTAFFERKGQAAPQSRE